MLFSAIIGGRYNFSAANNQSFNSKNKTYCQKTSLYLFKKMVRHELKSVSHLIIKHLLIQEPAPAPLYLLRSLIKFEIFANKFKHHEIVFYQTNLITLHQQENRFLLQ